MSDVQDIRLEEVEVDEISGEFEEEFISEEINISDEVVRIAVLPREGNEAIEKVNVSVRGNDIVRSFPLNFKFILPENSGISELVGKPNDVTMNEMASLLGITDQTRNMFSYWILDVTQEMIVSAQRQGLSKFNQVSLLNWFSFISKQIQLTSLPRKDFFGKLDSMFLKAEKMMESSGTENVPFPTTVLGVQGDDAFFVYYAPPPKNDKPKEDERPPPPSASSSKMKQSTKVALDKSKEPKTTVVEETLETEEEGEFYDPGPPPITVKDLMAMVELLYDIFADRLAYDIIRDVFWDEATVETVCISERILAPKQLLPEDMSILSVEPDGDLAAFEGPITIEELLRNGEKLDDFTEEEKKLKIQEAELRRAKDRYILPLADAIDSVYFRKIYPDVKGISKFVFVKRKKMNQYRQAHSSKKSLQQGKVKQRKSKVDGRGRASKASRRSSKKSISSRKSVSSRKSLKARKSMK